MATFTKVNPGDPIQAHQLNQVIDALIGTAGAGVPIAVTAVNDAVNYALTVQNDESGNSRALNVLKSDGSTLIRADAAGVTLGSPLNLPANSITSAAIADGGIQNVDLGPDVARANLLTNGGLEIWQRGSTFSGGYTADRWQIGGTVTVTRETTIVDNGSVASAKAVVSGGTQYLGQTIEGPGQFGSRTLSWSARVWASAANAVRLNLQTNGSGNNYSAYHPGGSGWQTLTVTVTMPASLTLLVAYLQFDAAVTAYLDNTALVVGSQPSNYVPLAAADDWARCLRYYELLGTPGDSSLGIAGLSYSGTQFQRQSFLYRAIKPVSPTVTIVNSWNTNNSGQPSVTNSGMSSCKITITSTGTGQFEAYNGNAGTTISVEANP